MMMSAKVVGLALELTFEDQTAHTENEIAYILMILQSLSHITGC